MSVKGGRGRDGRVVGVEPGAHGLGAFGEPGADLVEANERLGAVVVGRRYCDSIRRPPTSSK